MCVAYGVVWCSEKCCKFVNCLVCFLFQAEDGIRDLVRSRGLGDVYKRQQRDRAGRAVVVEKRLPERVRQVAADQHLEVAMRPLSLIHI